VEQMMDYKDSLNLPRTGFPMKAELVTREPERLQKWEAARLYYRLQAARAQAETFVLHDGPPFANGDVHIGNALNKILKDMVVKYHSICGQRSPYVPGWDCHGLPIEFKVTQEMRQAGRPLADTASLRSACQAYALKYVDLQRNQFRRLGVLGDWDHPYLTLDKAYEAAELRMFADIVEKGFVYRGKKPVYWSIPCRTALAEAEVEYQDHLSQSLYVKFPVVGQPGMSVLIWTTTPWTLPANLAVAFHSGFAYSLVRVGQESFLVAAALLPSVAEKCRWVGYEIMQSVTGAQLEQLRYHHPFCQRTGKLFAGDEFVDESTGSGFVHIAPGHGLEDYLLGLREGLPVYSPVNDDGCFSYTDDLPLEEQMPAEMVGKSILEKHGQSEANAVVLHELRRRNALLHVENYHHTYPHCWRSKTPVIFRAMDQWFIEIDHVVDEPGAALPEAPGRGAKTFRQTALESIERVRWVPESGKQRIVAAVESRPDWCISRQRAWGVPIPAFFAAQGKPILDARIIRKTAELVEEHGSNVWFEKSAADLWALVRPEGWQGPEAAAKSTDTLDVWIDSGSSSRGVLMRLPELSQGTSETSAGPPPWQADMYLEGSDQHRGWFQSSLMLSLAGNGAPPYRTVLTHGFMVDADREKIAKSKQGQGIYQKPQTLEAYLQKWGADILRLWVASQDYRNDIIVSEERISKVAESYRVIRNALRYQLSNLFDFDPARHMVADEQLTRLDRWVLDAFARLEAEAKRAYEQYEFHVVYQKVSQFAAVELSAVYHDIIKDRLYTDPADSPRRRATQTALYRMVTGLCQMLSPILTFTADEAWEAIPAVKDGQSVHETVWKPREFARPDDECATWAQLMELRSQALPVLEIARRQKLIGKALEAKLRLSPGPEAPSLSPALLEDLRELLNVSQLALQPAADAEASAWEVARADGQKCERCWHWETDVGSHVEHPTICGRCRRAVAAAANSGSSPAAGKT
jgi:isoleucyl-tRNA synthetase